MEKSRLFYEEKEFKDTEIGKIPIEWDIARLEDLVYFKNGERPQALDYGNIPIYGANGIIGYTNKALSDNDFTLIIGRVGASGQIHLGSGEVWVSDNAIYSAKYEKSKVDLWYLFYLLKYKKLERFASKTTHPIITQSFLNKFLVPLPPLSEQVQIASILSVMDQAIQKTDEVIAKTERLKKGMMQKLLTRGLGHKEFKETPIGTIPKTWQVAKLGDVVLEAKSGFASGKRDENGILQLRMDNIETEGWINPEAGVKVPMPPNIEEYILKPNDILFNNTNSVDLIGKTAIFRGELPKCVYSNHLTRIRVNPEKVIPEWILFVLVRKWQIGVFKAICHRHVHQAGINNCDLLNIKIPLPEIPEQQKMAQILLTTDKKLKIERQEKVRLEKIKQGLMDLLLTGKIRVKVGS